MNSTSRSLHRDRALVITTPEQLAVVTTAHHEGPVVALLADRYADDLDQLTIIVTELLKAGCDYFVCAGRNSEKLHDEVDLLVERATVGGLESSISTTWHVDETSDEVAEFFANVAGARDASLLVAVIGTREPELYGALLKLLEDDPDDPSIRTEPDDG